jgi:hypothetical protein
MWFYFGCSISITIQEVGGGDFFYQYSAPLALDFVFIAKPVAKRSYHF